MTGVSARPPFFFLCSISRLAKERSRREPKVCKTWVRGVPTFQEIESQQLRRLLRTFVMLASAGAICAPGASLLAKEKPASWKIIEDALFRVNDQPVKDWGVYQTGKKRDPLLVQMNNRFLLVEIREKQIFEVDPAKIQHKADELLWDPSDHPAQPVAATDWFADDTEAVFLIRARLSAEDRLLDIELPHQLDPSRMSPHAPASRR
jgi:hypothetical protein